MLNKRSQRIESYALMTEDQLEQCYRKTAARLSFSIKAKTYSRIPLIFLGACCYVGMLTLFGIYRSPYLWLLPIAAVALYCLWRTLDHLVQKYSKLYDELKPLADKPDLCVKSLKITEIDEDARAWRDKAIEAGRQLRVFDFMAMDTIRDENVSALYKREAEERAARELEQAKLACSKLHKVTA